MVEIVELKDLKQYKAKLEKMTGLDLKIEHDRLKNKYGQKSYTSEEWAELNKVRDTFLEVQVARLKEFYARKGMKTRALPGKNGFFR